jgi:hypothetical protein
MSSAHEKPMQQVNSPSRVATRAATRAIIRTNGDGAQSSAPR